MPRPRKPDGREPKSRSRNGCWSCKARKVKCTEERPSCAKCIKGGYQCDYGIRLNWDGRRSKRPQLKAVHLDSTQLMNDETESDTHDGAGTGIISFQTRPDQTQNDSVPSPQSTSSSSVTSLSKVACEQVTFMPIQVPGHLKPQPKSRSSKAAVNSITADSDSPFRILAPMVSTTSPSSFHFEVRTAHSRRGAAPTSSAKASKPSDGTARTSRNGSISLPKAPGQPSSGRSDEASYLSDTASNSGQQTTQKRPRLDSDVSERDFAWTWPMSPSTASGSISAASPRQNLSGRGDASSPQQSEDGQPLVSPHSASSFLYMNASDFRRMSVNSLLSGPQDLSGNAVPTSAAGLPILPQAADTPDGGYRGQHRRASGSHHHQNHHRSSAYFGIDGGFHDLDLGKNDDANALSGVGKGPCAGRKENGVSRGHGGYYNKPVAVRIPNTLGKLPTKLTENPMNMLYFHHFINHTARVLVPHDDPKSNPFRTILPQMALKNDNLLSLLLAYSASHRARVLDQAEPGMRIALWVQDIFPALRSALDDHKQKISNANVATAIMLASLAIVSPTAFGYNIPWQKHLMLARQIIAARPEGLRVDHHSSIEGQVCSFLWSWFAYLDVLGGLSGGPTDASPAWILDYKVYDPQDDDEIDCIMGFTTRCVYILSQIAELVRLCEPERLRITKKDPDGWVPSMEIDMRVDSLDVDVRDSMQQVPRACSHLHHSGDVVRWDRKEMSATNEAYHWAALVHLHRRVLGKPAEHPDVSVPVQRIIECLDRVSVGGTAENCLLFPLFTAGCECTDNTQRKKLLKRMLSVEGIGMMQVTRARSLMQKTWGMGKPWETILTSEFIG